MDITGMDLQPMGFDAIKARYEELRAKRGVDSQPAFSLPSGMSGLTGNIGSGGSDVKPANPFGPGLKVQSNSAFKSLIDKAANDNGVDPALLDALVEAESNYDPNCRSRAGAVGLTQLMPGTAKELGVGNLLDPEQSLQGGAKYLSSLIGKYKKLDLALAAYNAGPGAVDRAGGNIPPYSETQNYVRKVLSLYGARRGG